MIVTNVSVWESDAVCFDGVFTQACVTVILCIVDVRGSEDCLPTLDGKTLKVVRHFDGLQFTRLSTWWQV